MATAARYCAIVTGVLQLLLALLSLWILIDLNGSGTQIRSLALILGAGFVVTQICILVLAYQLSPDSPRRLWSLVTLYSLGLAVLLSIDLFDLSIDFKSLILRPGAVLPPNEIMGRDWPLVLAILSVSAAILIGLLPQMTVGAVLLFGSHKSPAEASSSQR